MIEGFKTSFSYKDFDEEDGEMEGEMGEKRMAGKPIHLFKFPSVFLQLFGLIGLAAPF